MIRSLEKNYLKLFMHRRNHRYYCWCSVWISRFTGCCWSLGLVDLQEVRGSTNVGYMMKSYAFIERYIFL